MFNTVILSGRLTKDAELKQTPSGKLVTSFTIANDAGYGDSKRTNFINIVAWQSTAEFIIKYFSKGSLIGIEGEIQTREYEDKDKNKRKAFEILAKRVEFMESKQAGSGIGPAPAPAPADPPQFEEIPQDDDLPF